MMRSSILFASTFVAGALARPHMNPHLRDAQVVNIVTEVAVETVYVVVTVTTRERKAMSTSSCVWITPTPSSAPPAAVPSATFSQPPVQSSVPKKKPEPKPSPSSEHHALPLSSSSSVDFKPQPTPEPSSKATPAPSPTSSATPKPEPKPAPSSKAAPTPSPKRGPSQASSTSLSFEAKPIPAPSPSPKLEPKSTLALAPSSAPPNTEPNVPNRRVKGSGEAYLSYGAEYEVAMLYHHNAARENHGAEPLTWDNACEHNARIAAEKCNFTHYIPDGAGQGQNLFTVSGKAFNATAGVRESWYKGELEPMKPYFGKPDVPDDVFHRVGHLTQIVWKNTNKIGCVSVDCGNRMIVGGKASTMNKYTVCNYAPAGNVYGNYAANVAAPISWNVLGGWAD